MKRKGSAFGIYVAIFSVLVFAIGSQAITGVFDGILPSYTSDVGWIFMLVLPVTFIILLFRGVSQ